MSNRYPGRCSDCGGHVRAGQGEVRVTRWSGYRIAHRPIECPALDKKEVATEVAVTTPAAV